MNMTHNLRTSLLHGVEGEGWDADEKASTVARITAIPDGAPLTDEVWETTDYFGLVGMGL